jgi:glycosyltransferase involved in cell wall biosynthesis
MPQAKPRLLYVVNIPRFFVSHRLPLALASREAGYDVHVATSSADEASIAQIHEAGLPFHPLPLSQHGTNPLAEVRTLWALIRLYRTLQPDLIHHVSIKPVIYGGIANKFAGHRANISAMSGLGYVFIGEGAKPTLLRQIVRPLFRYALSGKMTRMIFQNPDDQERFIKMGLIASERTALIRGSGVDMTQFQPTPEPTLEDEGLPVVLFAGRLMWKKGVGAFVDVAKRLKNKARFVVVGYAEATSPDNVPPEKLRAWADEGIIEWWGKRDDMPEVFAQAHIVVLPSTYGEGVPKVLIEASACGRAIVTTNTAGCREIVRHEENGLLVTPSEGEAFISDLTQATQRLIDDSATRQRMGQAGRHIASEEFSLAHVVAQTFALYEALLAKKR